MDADAAESLLRDVFAFASGGSPVIVNFSGVNMTGVQLPSLRTSGYSGGPSSILLKLDNTVIAKNQIVLFAAMAAQGSLQLDLQVSNSRILDNQITLAAGIAIGDAGAANLQVINSEISGNMVAVAGALAIGDAAAVIVNVGAGSATNNMLAGAALVATGGLVSGDGTLSTDANANTLVGAGLPFFEEPVVAAILATVMNAVYVDGSSGAISTSLTNVQTQLCVAMAEGGSIYTLLVNDNYNSVLYSAFKVAEGLLCSPTSSIRLSDIPGMIDGTASASTMSTMRALSLLARGQGGLQFKSLAGVAKTFVNNPRALSMLPELLAQLTVVPK